MVSAAFGSFVLWRTMGADGITLGMGIAFVASLAGLTYALGTGEANLGDASTWIQAALTTAFGSITGITLLTNLGAAAGTAATLSIGLAGLITFAGITFSLGEKLKEFPVLDTIITVLMGILAALLVLALHYLLVQVFLLLEPLLLLVSVLALFFTGLVSNGVLKRAVKNRCCRRS